MPARLPDMEEAAGCLGEYVMEGELLLTIGKDGKARLYDDTYDITIHCESQEEQDRVCALLKHIPHWIPCSERMPETDEDGYSDKLLVCFSNFTGCEICEYRIIDGIGKWYIGDSDDCPDDIGVKVIAWMHLPEPYKGEAAADMRGENA